MNSTVKFLSLQRCYKYAFEPEERQALRACAEVKKRFNDKAYLDIHFRNFMPYENKQFTNFCPVVVGNLAYLALHCPFTEISHKCYNALAAYQIYLYDNNLL